MAKKLHPIVEKGVRILGETGLRALGAAWNSLLGDAAQAGRHVAGVATRGQETVSQRTGVGRPMHIDGDDDGVVIEVREVKPRRRKARRRHEDEEE